MPANLENSAVAIGLERSVFILIPKKGNAKECSNYRTIALISHATKVMLKILQARLQQYMNHELPDVQDRFRKSRGTRDQIANIHWIIEIASKFQESSYFCFIDYVKAFDCVDHNKLWKSLKKMGIPDHLVCLPKNLHAGQEATEPNMKQWTGSKLGKEYIKSVYCYLAYLTYMQSTSCEMPGWMNHKLGSRWLREISIASDMQMIQL